jgi:choline dehydrogenase
MFPKSGRDKFSHQVPVFPSQLRALGSPQVQRPVIGSDSKVDSGASIVTSVFPMSLRFDTIVVGAGTAGCVIAARLTEDASHNTLLIEAGQDYLPSAEFPRAIQSVQYVPMRGHAPEGYYDPQHDWNLNVKVSSDGSSMQVPQARLVGGGSAINGSIALRGPTMDYDKEWSGLGNPHWTWRDVLPAYKLLEDDIAPDSKMHGKGRPVPINRTHKEELSKLARAFVESSQLLGYPYVHDLNNINTAGVGPVPQARVGSRRISMANAYIDPVRKRSNLKIKSNAHVNRILFSDKCVTCVELTDGTIYHTRRIVMCAGAILTPAILQRSGIGQRAHLAALGISVIQDLPVGANLGDHFAVPLLAAPKPGAWSPEDFSLQVALRRSSTIQPGSFDMQLTFFSYLNPGKPDVGVSSRSLAGNGKLPANVTSLAGVACVLNKPRSTGTIRITSTDPMQLPDVNPNNLASPIDRKVARELLRAGWAVITQDPLKSLLGPPLVFTEEIMADDAKLDEAIATNNSSAYHFAGTCKMAPVEKGGVVDPSGRVWGMKGLVVGDASIIPVVPGANTMLPTIMTAERIAQALKFGGMEKIKANL